MGFVSTGRCVTLSIFSVPGDACAIRASDGVFYPGNWSIAYINRTSSR